MVNRFLRFPLILAVIWFAAVSPIDAQGTGLEFGAGLWLSDSTSTIYMFTIERRLLGPFDYGLGVAHVRGRAGAYDNQLTGGELSIGLFRNGSGPFLVSAGGLGMRHSSGNFDAQWSAGAGYEVRALAGLSIGLEGRYRVEDRASRGFWRLQPDDARGLVIKAQMTLRFGGQMQSSGPTHSLDPYRDTQPKPAYSPNRFAIASRDVDDLRNDLVATALEAMGTPYSWGGDSEDGFDCSGLIQFAYGAHGLLLPRTSRDQARMGQQVDRSVDGLEPGDILGFSDGGGGVTHVGLYVGDGMFIHSSSTGVKLSSLTAPEGDGRWWQQRWVTARRLIY